jgi:hypothetical protein
MDDETEEGPSSERDEGERQPKTWRRPVLQRLNSSQAELSIGPADDGLAVGLLS